VKVRQLLDPDEALRRLETRLGPLHAQLRLDVEREHEAQAFGQGLSFLHLENLPLMQAMIEVGLRVTGTYWRGRANAGKVQVRRNIVRLENLPSAFDGFTILHLSDLHADLSGPASTCALTPETGTRQGRHNVMRTELTEKLMIRELIENWAVWRDSGDWERFATVWHDDGVMMATWFQGPAKDFVRVTQEGWAKGVSILHFLGGSSVELRGNRSVTQTKMTIRSVGWSRACSATSSAQAASTTSWKSAPEGGG